MARNDTQRELDLRGILLTGAEIWVHDPAVANYNEMLILEGRIAALGRKDELSHDPPSGIKVIKLPGGLLIPPFFDGHLHLDLGGRYLKMLKLRDCKSTVDALKAIERAAAKGEGWLVGIGLPETSLTSREELDRVGKGRPLLLYTRDCHSAFVNSAAMENVGIDADTVFPEGGWQETDTKGLPLGILRENAVDWLVERLPDESEEDIRRYILKAFAHLVSLGVLGASDASYPNSWDVLRKLRDDEGLPIHLEQWVRCTDLDESCFQSAKSELSDLRRTRIKLFLDGSLGSRTAWMKKPYLDHPGYLPRPVPNLDRFQEFLIRGAEHGWSFAVHAIGDAAVEFALQSLAKIPTPGGRHRVEHLQHVDESSLKNIAATDLIPSVQPLHRIEDLGMLEGRVGKKRAAMSYPCRSLLKHGRPLASGSDWPVASADPLRNIHAAIRKRGPGEGMPGEELTPSQAVEAITRGSALAAGFTDIGEIRAGAPGDLVLLNLHPHDSAEAWLETSVQAVWRSGKLIHRLMDFETFIPDN